MSSAVDDDLWSAVGDPTRRHILDVLLSTGGATATTLSDELPITRQAVAKHLHVLDRVGLVDAVVVGRERRYEVDIAQVARAAAQLAEVGAKWDGRLQRIKRIAEQIQRAADGTADNSALQPGLPDDDVGVPTRGQADLRSNPTRRRDAGDVDVDADPRQGEVPGQLREWRDPAGAGQVRPARLSRP